MAEPGKAVVLESGKIGLLDSGGPSVFNADGQCPSCCIEFTQAWSFTDQGFIDGG